MDAPPRPLAREASTAGAFFKKPSPWVNLALTLPIFLLYQLGVVGLGVRNGTDLVTAPLLRLSEGNVYLYFGITLGMGAAFALVLFILGRGHGFRLSKFVQIACEGVLYAVLMRFGASYVVGRLFAGPVAAGDPFTGLIMSLGAGFYEELAFRVILFGLGAKLLVWLIARKKVQIVGEAARGALGFRAVLVMCAWAVVAAAIFSGVHYIGPMADTFQLGSFVFRLLLGLALTLIYATRGFAAGVWAHAVYDIWVMLL